MGNKKVYFQEIKAICIFSYMRVIYLLGFFLVHRATKILVGMFKEQNTTEI